ncbi:MAG: GHMP kinase [Candidatus Promineifilaceae bacterium]
MALEWPDRPPARTITATAPIRICDNGGWTDTWFARRGKVFNIAVRPVAEVQVELYPAGVLPERVLIYAENYGQRYALRPGQASHQPHPLLAAAIEIMALPDDSWLHVSIFSDAPAGASTGTSAAVTVALVAALDRLTPGRLSARDVAYKAHSVEVDLLGQQSGIQDQLCSAYGGLNFIDIHDYPHAAVTPIRLPGETWWELERRLALIYLGKAHASSDVHLQVLRELQDAGPESRPLADLRATAEPARDAVLAADFAALGRAMIANTEAQRRLHPALVSQDAERVIALAREHGALGWKVNGAGGEGGSLTLLCGRRSAARRAMLQAIKKENPMYQNIPVQLSHDGLRVWEQTGEA